jgi:hypothetical protein
MCTSFISKKMGTRPVLLAYQPPASSTFLSQQISHQQSASSTFLSEQISTSHQPNKYLVRGGTVKVGYTLLRLRAMACRSLPPTRHGHFPAPGRTMRDLFVRILFFLTALQPLEISVAVRRSLLVAFGYEH